MANIVRRPKPPGAAGLTTITRSRLRSTRSRSWPSNRSASSKGAARPASRSGPSAGKPLRSARSRSDISTRTTSAVWPRGIERTEHRRRIGAAATGRRGVDDGELATDRAPVDPAGLVHHRQRRLPVALVDAGRWAAVGVGDHRGGQPGVDHGLAEGAGHRAVEQAVGVAPCLLDRERQHRRISGIVAGEGLVELGARLRPDVLRRVDGVPGPARDRLAPGCRPRS